MEKNQNPQIQQCLSSGLKPDIIKVKATKNLKMKTISKTVFLCLLFICSNIANANQESDQQIKSIFDLHDPYQKSDFSLSERGIFIFSSDEDKINLFDFSDGHLIDSFSYDSSPGIVLYSPYCPIKTLKNWLFAQCDQGGKLEITDLLENNTFLVPYDSDTVIQYLASQDNNLLTSRYENTLEIFEYENNHKIAKIDSFDSAIKDS